MQKSASIERKKAKSKLNEVEINPSREQHHFDLIFLATQSFDDIKLQIQSALAWTTQFHPLKA